MPTSKQYISTPHFPDFCSTRNMPSSTSKPAINAVVTLLPPVYQSLQTLQSKGLRKYKGVCVDSLGVSG
ncbi:MAG: hypothetical protein FJZ83_04230 [Chloroflexi bacterium]|nr:hypothetical protein [Chloroflexota bacterium]MBM3183226.1 hypothetical protein [Chloroflexota bacterium]